ncbi:MAG: hypothetical protein IPI60_19625 [Saprospiraceae bacterium]|nr:hypothetical protein [Saprospiraceae bacterium]
MIKRISIFQHKIDVSIPLFLLFAIALLSSCGESSGKRDITKYYFPYKSLEDGKVYIYSSALPDQPEDYWFYKSLQQDGKWYLTAQNYDPNMEVRQFQSEVVVENGTVTENYVLFRPTPEGRPEKIKTEVLQGNQFPFRVTDSLGVFLFSLKWTEDTEPVSNTTLTRNRRFLGDTSFIFQGKTIPAIRMSVRDLLEFDQEGTLEVETEAEEWYAENLGLVYLRKKINNNISMEYTLDTLVEMEYFIQKYLPRQ